MLLLLLLLSVSCKKGIHDMHSFCFSSNYVQQLSASSNSLKFIQHFVPYTILSKETIQVLLFLLAMFYYSLEELILRYLNTLYIKNIPLNNFNVFVQRTINIGN